MNRLELSARSRIRDGKLDGYKAVAADFIRQTAEKDSRTLRFDWYLSQDSSEAEIREEYLDPQGFIEHKTNTAEITQRLFAEFATDHHVAVFGDPPAALVEKVGQTPMGKTVTWFHFFQGFHPEPVSHWSRDINSGPAPGLELAAHMTVRPGQSDGFRKQAAEMLRLTREKDTRTLRYDWFLSADGTEWDVREAYVDVSGLVQHNSNIAQAREVLFEQFADNHFMSAYGDITQELLELVKATRMEGRFKCYTLLGGLDSLPQRSEVGAARSAT